MSGKESSLRSRVLELERELLNMEEQLGKGECARINAYMQKHFNDILSFLSRFLTVRERPKLYSRELRAALKLLSTTREKGFCSHFQKPPNLH